MDAPLQAFNPLRALVQTFNNNGHIIHRLRCTGPDLFRQNKFEMTECLFNDLLLTSYLPVISTLSINTTYRCLVEMDPLVGWMEENQQLLRGKQHSGNQAP